METVYMAFVHRGGGVLIRSFASMPSIYIYIDMIIVYRDLPQTLNPSPLTISIGPHGLPLLRNFRILIPVSSAASREQV